MKKQNKRLEMLKNFFKVKDNLTFDEICKILSVPRNDYRELDKLLKKLEEQNCIYCYNNKYKLIREKDLLIGKIRLNKLGFGFVKDENGIEYYISKKNTKNALDGDKVKIILIDKKGNLQDAKVVEIVEKSKRIIIGEYVTSKKGDYLLPLESGFVGKKFKIKEKLKDKTLVAFELINDKIDIKKIIGPRFEPHNDAIALLIKNNIEYEFNEQTLLEASKLPQKVLEDERLFRKDLTNELIITIDGEDTKDFDDAVSLDKIGNNYLLKVSIADVAHYVNLNSNIGKTAIKRATSHYLIDTVIPMLPEALSNGICSLNENVDRLAITVEILFDDNANILSTDIYESVIKVKKRMTYTQVTNIIEGHESISVEYYNLIMNMYDLTKKLLMKHSSEGYIAFDRKEMICILNEDLSLKDLVYREQNIAMKIIEEFMVTTNSVVAKMFFDKKLPFLYRVHDKPTDEKMESFIEILKCFNVKIPKYDEINQDFFNEILKSIENDKNKIYINEYMLRTMSLARYDIHKSPHFGIGKNDYSHFTSPIRRMPDLFIHTVIKEYLHNKLEYEKYTELSNEVMIQSNKVNEISKELEREILKIKQIEYLKKIDKYKEKEFNAKIVGMNGYGIFVIVEDKFEGIIPFSSLDEYYEKISEIEYLGEYSKNKIIIGQDIKVKIVFINYELNEIECSLIKIIK